MSGDVSAQTNLPVRAPASGRERRSRGKPDLPPKTRRTPPQWNYVGYRETPEVVDGVVRLIRAVGKRIATEDPEALELLRCLEAEISVAWRVAVAGQRRAGFSDREIADALAVTRPAVTQRWPRAAEEPLGDPERDAESDGDRHHFDREGAR